MAVTLITNYFMEDFEGRAAYMLVCWFHYIDDYLHEPSCTFMFWPHGRIDLNDFLSHLSSIH